MALKQKPKILITVTVAETAYSFLKEQVSYLLEKGYRVEIASGEGSWIKLSEVRKVTGVPVHRVPLTRTINFASDIRSFLALYFLMRKIRPDILHASTPKAAVISLLSGWLARIPVRIYLMRGIPYCNARGITRRFFFFLFAQTCRMAHAVLCVSKSNRDFVVSNKISEAEKTTVLHNGSSHGVDAQGQFNPANVSPSRIAALKRKYELADHAVVFGFVGRIVKDKGIENLIAAWKPFVRDKKNVHLFIIGHREARDTVSDACLTDMESHPSVHLVNDSIDPYEYYSLFDIFIFPSHREGFPNAVLEASAMELPVITTNATGCVDSVKNGITGYVVPVFDTAALLDKMNLLYADPELRKTLGRSGRSHVLENYDQKTLCSELERFVRRMCDTRGVALRGRLAIVTSVPATLFHLFSNQIERIINEGFELILVSSAGDQWISYRDVEKKYGCKVFCMPFRRTFSVFSDLYTIAALWLFLLKMKLDIIYYCTPKASLLTSIAASLAKVPFRIYSVFGQVYYGKKGFIEAILLMCEKITCTCSHKVILMSKSNLDYLSAKRLCSPQKMGILGHGTNQGVDAKVRFNPLKIDVSAVRSLKRKLGISENNVVMGYIGRLVREKGVIDLINAWEKVKLDTTPCTLLLIGPRNEPRDQLPENVYEETVIDPTIKLIEPVSDPESYYAIMDIFILPSYREGFPNVVLEAAAMGLPVITTNAIGCIDSVIDNKTGFIIPQRNVPQLIEKMLFLLHNPKMRKNMGQQARERTIAHFDADKVTDELIYLIKNRFFMQKSYA